MASILDWFSKKPQPTTSGGGRSSSKPYESQRAASRSSPSANGSVASASESAIAVISAEEEAKIISLGEQLLDKAKAHKSGLMSAQFYSDALMNWSMKDPLFKVQLFRFVDCFPVLKDSDDIYDHLQDYMSQPGVSPPAVIAGAIKLGGLAKSLAVSQISKQITGMASKFIAGTDARSAAGNLQSLWNDGIAFSVDLLGEACVSDKEADEYRDKYLDLVRNLPGLVKDFKPDPRLENDNLGAIPRTNVSVKISSLSARCDPIDAPGAQRDLMTRLLPILSEAKANGVFVNFDMEQFALKDFTLDLFMTCCEQVAFDAGLAMQAYLKSGPADAHRIGQWAKKSGRVVTVRLVKGAYWDYEVINAEQRGWPCPVWGTKPQTDACFECMSRILLDYAPRSAGEGGIKLALGSHNVRSIASTMAAADARNLPRSAVEIQMLHGMADQLKFAMSDIGMRVREYVPVGQMIPGMAYLVRRLLENTSNESWLKAGFLDGADTGVLLANPATLAGKGQDKSNLILTAPERHNLSAAVAGVGDGRPFYTEPFRDFARAAEHNAFTRAVESVNVPRVANDTTPQQAAAMVAAAHAAFPAWRGLDAKVRANVLIRAADLMRDRRDDLSAVMIREAGKTWREADADTAEAIDFCDYYARQAVGLFDRERIGRFIGELDEQMYQPRGVAVIIAPWNFPLAICCGMTVAALVTGNPVVIKPAEQTPGIAKLLFDILQRAIGEVTGDQRLAREVVQFCPGPGETTGAALVRDARVALIAFTGSRDVGLDILSAASPPSPFGSHRAAAQSLNHVKRVVCEMGGKNAIIIDTSADLDEAVLAVRHSAFGFSGQKCSACSRLIVVDQAGPNGPAIKHFTERLIEATRALTVGDPALPGTDIGPVIDAEAQAKINGFIERAKAGGLSCFALPIPAGLEQATGRHFVPPTIFTSVPADHELATQEIFGPVLAVIHASSFEDALSIANSSPYKLTGGVFSRKPSHLEMAKREFRVGNLYINRGCTGALVARQPFGGFGMSGVGSKAGGRDYLLQFVEPRAICENTMRRGFAPEL